MSCCCSLPPTCCNGCSNNRIPGIGLTIGGIYNHPPPMPKFVFTEEDRRELAWAFSAGGKLLKPVCVYFRNLDRGIECTAKNCPCELYEVE